MRIPKIGENWGRSPISLTCFQAGAGGHHQFSEFLSQLHTLKATHPGLADTASKALALIRRGVLEELP